MSALRLPLLKAARITACHFIVDLYPLAEEGQPDNTFQGEDESTTPVHKQTSSKETRNVALHLLQPEMTPTPFII